MYRIHRNCIVLLEFSHTHTNTHTHYFQQLWVWAFFLLLAILKIFHCLLAPHLEDHRVKKTQVPQINAPYKVYVSFIGQRFPYMMLQKSHPFFFFQLGEFDGMMSDGLI